MSGPDRGKEVEEAKSISRGREADMTRAHERVGTPEGREQLAKARDQCVTKATPAFTYGL